MQTIKLINADVAVGLKTLADESVDLIVTSPPYNVGKEYEIGVSNDEYLTMIGGVCDEFVRVLKPDGRFCINVPATMNSEQRTQFVMNDWERAIIDAGLTMRDYVIWNQSNSGNDTAWGSWKSASSPWLRHQTEMIIVGYNKQWKKINKGESDITRDEFLESVVDLWTMPCARCSWHPAVFPDELAKRCIKLFSYVGDTILDPYVGSGTVMKVGRDLKRNVVGIDRDKGYCDKIRSSDAFNQSTLADDVDYVYKEL